MRKKEDCTQSRRFEDVALLPAARLSLGPQAGQFFSLFHILKRILD